MLVQFRREVLWLALCLFSANGQGASERFTVALVDKFYPLSSPPPYAEDQLDRALYGLMDLDRDAVNEPLYHGDVVRLIVSDPRIDVRNYEVRSGYKALDELLRNLQLVRRDLFWEEPIDAVLFPWESSTLISAFAQGALDKQHRNDYLDRLGHWAGESEVWSTTLQIIYVLEDIVDFGGIVFTIAGNGGHRMINTYSFAEGVVTVGAKEAALSDFISNNVFVDIHEQAAYLPVRINSELGEVLGYDVSGNGCVDVAVSTLSGNGNAYPKQHWKWLKGSSFAAPMALKKHLLGRQTQRCLYQHN